MRNYDTSYFKDMLLERKKRVEKNLADCMKEMDELNELEINDEVDYASISADSQIESSMFKQQKREFNEINIALKKIEDGSYGICEMCEESISIQRLKVKPHAKYCIICREIHEKTPQKG